jgi:hypothetical protein
MKRSKLPFAVIQYLNLVSHRLSLAESARAAGFEVAVAVLIQIRCGHNGWNTYPGGATGDIGYGIH